jgi:hypothetical protein
VRSQPRVSAAVRLPFPWKPPLGRQRTLLMRLALSMLFISVLMQAVAHAQIRGMNDLLWAAPSPSGDTHTNNSPTPTPYASGGAPSSPSIGGFYIYANATARAAVIQDSTRLVSTNGGFLTSTIPVPGQPFYGAPSQSQVSASGSIVDFSASNPTPTGPATVAFNSRITLNNATAGGDTSSGAQTVALQMANIQYRRIFVGLGETAFADTSALPTIFDITGPTARVTGMSGGTGTGIGRLSLTWLSPLEGMPAPGLSSILSVENPVAEIQSGTAAGAPVGKGTSPFSRCPDFISTTFYSDGYMDQKQVYQELYHVQSSTVVRSLGLQSDNESVVSNAAGWGESISARVAIPFTSQIDAPDMVVASYTVGQGIAHYIVDLQTPANALKSGGNDAWLDTAGNIIPLPVTAWYAAYMHNWAPNWQSCICYSYTSLQSFVSTNPLTPTVLSPFRHGQYAQVNLQRTVPFTLPKDKAPNQHWLQYGIEFIYGQKQTLDGAIGHDARGLFVLSVTK